MLQVCLPCGNYVRKIHLRYACHNSWAGLKCPEGKHDSGWLD